MSRDADENSGLHMCVMHCGGGWLQGHEVSALENWHLISISPNQDAVEATGVI